jgi:hypothetical protein
VIFASTQVQAWPGNGSAGRSNREPQISFAAIGKKPVGDSRNGGAGECRHADQLIHARKRNNGRSG